MKNDYLYYELCNYVLIKRLFEIIVHIVFRVGST